VPPNERSLKRHERPYMLRNEARRVVRNGATSRNRSAVGEGICRSVQGFATIHSERDRVLVFLRVRVEFDSHGVGIHIIEKNLNVK